MLSTATRVFKYSILTLHRYYKHIEDVHVTKRIFDKITAFFTWTYQTLEFIIDGMCWRVLGVDRTRGRDWCRNRARGRDWHEGITCVLQTQFFWLRVDVL